MNIADTVNMIIEVFNWGRRDTDELKNARYVEFKTERIPFRSPSWARADSASGPSTAAPRRSRLDSRVAGKRQPVAELEMTTPRGMSKDGRQASARAPQAMGDVYSFMPVQAGYGAPAQTSTCARSAGFSPSRRKPPARSRPRDKP